MMDQAYRWATYDNRFSERRQGQVAVQSVTGRAADDAAGEQVDDDGEVQPALYGPNVQGVGAPFLVQTRRDEILIQQVRRYRPGVVAVRDLLEPPLLPLPGTYSYASDALSGDGRPAGHHRAARA